MKIVLECDWLDLEFDERKPYHVWDDYNEAEIDVDVMLKSLEEYKQDLEAFVFLLKQKGKKKEKLDQVTQPATQCCSAWGYNHDDN